MDAGLLFVFHMEKMSHNLSGNNADVYPLHKRRFGFRILLKQTDVRYTIAQVHLSVLRT